METEDPPHIDGKAKEDHQDPALSSEEAQMSKNQLKKLKKREKWLSIKQDKRRNAKLKRKLRLAEMREKGEDTGPTRKSLKKKSMKNSLCRVKVVVDLTLDEYMSEKDVNSLTCQLQHSYSANRRADNPMQLYFCGISGKTKERLDKIGDYKGWDIYPETRGYDQVFPKESLIYLSSESNNVLTSLSEDKVYVIGGLVDHNKHKGLCHSLAEEKGIAHAQLPISEYLDMKTRKVLTVNQVFSILLRYTETGDWKTAFLAELPQRKQANTKDQTSGQAPTVQGISDLEDNTSSESKEPGEAPPSFTPSSSASQTPAELQETSPTCPQPASELPLVGESRETSAGTQGSGEVPSDSTSSDASDSTSSKVNTDESNSPGKAEGQSVPLVT